MTSPCPDLKRFLEPLPLPGGNALPSRILPGPMEGIMTADFCTAANEFDLVPMWTTPFIRISTAVPRRSRLARRLKPFSPVPIVPQIMGTNTQLLAQSTAQLASMDNVVGVELNCACPSNTVMRSGSGAALLQRPDWIRSTLISMRAATDHCGIGIKIRTGVESHTELPRILAAVHEAQPDWVVVHYRTALEGYSTVADGYARLTTARKLLPDIPLFVSGDLFNPQTCIKLGRELAIDGMTPARGLMRNPWLIRDAEMLCRDERLPQRNILPFLIRLVELGRHRPHWRRGLVLEIARNAWGEESAEFQQILQHTAPDALLAALSDMP